MEKIISDCLDEYDEETDNLPLSIEEMAEMKSFLDDIDDEELDEFERPNDDIGIDEDPTYIDIEDDERKEV